MAENQKLELVSFDICPYVQRSVITLKHKKVDFKITYIDLEKPPEWFHKLSPLGKVPLLLVRGAAGSGAPVALFESAVINEYVDEITPPSLMPGDPLQKARERAWVEVSSEMMSSLFTVSTSQDREEAAESVSEIWETLSRVEAALPGGKYFSTRGFSLVDAAFAPFFMRLFMMKSARPGNEGDAHWKSLPKTRTWAEALLELPEVRDSVIPEFKARYVETLRKYGSPIAGDLI